MGWRLRIFASGPFRILTRSCRSPTGQWLAHTAWAWVQQENILYSLHTRILFKNLRIVITTNPQKPVILCCGLHANACLWPRMAQFSLCFPPQWMCLYPAVFPAETLYFRGSKPFLFHGSFCQSGKAYEPLLRILFFKGSQ